MPAWSDDSNANQLTSLQIISHHQLIIGMSEFAFLWILVIVVRKSKNLHPEHLYLTPQGHWFYMYCAHEPSSGGYKLAVHVICQIGQIWEWSIWFITWMERGIFFFLSQLLQVQTYVGADLSRKCFFKKKITVEPCNRWNEPELQSQDYVWY